MKSKNIKETSGYRRVFDGKGKKVSHAGCRCTGCGKSASALGLLIAGTAVTLASKPGLHYPVGGK